MHALAVMAEGPRAASGLDALSLAGTVAYAILGVLLLMVFAWAINTIFKLDLRRDLDTLRGATASASPQPADTAPEQPE